MLARSLRYYWRTNVAVVGGVAVTVAVLAGALLVGDSVRASLRELFLERLGKVSYVISSDHFFREALAVDLQAAPQFKQHFSAAAPLIAFEGVVTHERSRRRASRVQVYGVDERFWQFHGRANAAPQNRELLLSPSLAAEFAAAPGDAILVRVEKPSAVPIEFLHGRRDDLGRTIRFTLREVVPADQLGEFSIRPQQGSTRAVFVPLKRLQDDLARQLRVNAMLISAAPEPGGESCAKRADAGPDKINTCTLELGRILKQQYDLADLELRLKELPDQHALSLESEQVLLSRAVESDAVWAAGGPEPYAELFTYLANTIRIRNKEIPYSLVTAASAELLQRLSIKGDQVNWPLTDDITSGSAHFADHPPLWLTQWAADDLNARVGDKVTLQYYVWANSGLVEHSTEFILRGILPMTALASGRNFAPEYPGISESPTLAGWNPPFPVDLKRIRPRDEEYWKKYRTTPKAFTALAAGRQFWHSNYGSTTAVRLYPSSRVSLDRARDNFLRSLHGRLDPLNAGFAIHAARARGAEASQGAVNFGEYFAYFSFFLVISAVMLAGLFFKLGVEQRQREIGVLQAMGYSRAQVSRLFFQEGAVLCAIGSAIGLLGAVAYAWVMMYGLRTWWVGAVSTTDLKLHVAPLSLALGAAGGLLAALVSIAWALRELRKSSALHLLTGARETVVAAARSPRNAILTGAALAIGAGVLLAAAATERINEVGGFFGSGALALAAFLAFTWAWLVRPTHAQAAHPTHNTLVRLGARNASWRPGRSLLCVALLASATFIIVAVDAFRRDPAAALDAHSGTGGYPLLAETLLPVPHDLNSRAGQQAMNLGDDEIAALAGARFTSFRLRPGEDASCLNLYRPSNPKILAADPNFISAGRFAFQSSVAVNDKEKGNPWQLLQKEFDDGAVPAIADYNSAAYVLHWKLGEDFILNDTTDPRTGKPVRLRLVATLRDSIFQSELLISEQHFLRVFPAEQGYRYFLIEPPAGHATEVSETLEESLADFGFDAESTAARLAQFHRVENTYLSTFQVLGGLGLLLGTFGLAAVLLRNVFERRRELALLRAIGYRPADLGVLLVAENAFLLLVGLLAGTASALLAIAPAITQRGGSQPFFAFGALFLAVLLVGGLTSLIAVRYVVRASVLEVLRAE